MASHVVYAFGRFVLHVGTRRLTRDGEPVALTEHQADVLLALLARPGDVVSRDDLVAAAWPDVAVGDNSLEQAISRLRRLLGGRDDAPTIETVPRRGYRLRAEVTRRLLEPSPATLAAELEPYRAWVEGRAALESLDAGAVSRAAGAFAAAVARRPEWPEAHVGLANARVMRFESTRADERPDHAALREAVHHAQEGCRLAPDRAEAWATLGFVLSRAERHADAVAAARRAVELEPENWRHRLRLASAAWGEARLEAARHALGLFPGFALAHWLAATVYVARQAFDLAARELEAGAAAQDAGRASGTPFRAVGSHWLLGLVRLATGDEEAALAAFGRELDADRGQPLHGRECAANTWSAVGAVALHRARRAEAVAAFRHALRDVPGHLPALTGLLIVDDPASRHEAGRDFEARLAQADAGGQACDGAAARGAVLVAAGRHQDAAALLEAALAAAPPGSRGWTIPVDPFLRVREHAVAFARVLAVIRSRAG